MTSSQHFYHKVFAIRFQVQHNTKFQMVHYMFHLIQKSYSIQNQPILFKNYLYYQPSKYFLVLNLYERFQKNEDNKSMLLFHEQ